MTFLAQAGPYCWLLVGFSHDHEIMKYELYFKLLPFFIGYEYSTFQWVQYSCRLEFVRLWIESICVTINVVMLGHQN